MENQTENSAIFAPFDSSLVSFTRNRYSITQGEYSISYDGKLIETSNGQSNWGDNIQLQENGEWEGCSDEELISHVEKIYNKGDYFNGIEPLKYNYPLKVETVPFVIYNKEKRDEHSIVNLENEDEVYGWIKNNLDTSKYWVYYSVEQLLKNHKEYCNQMDYEYEFHYIDDIVNNERAFQHILTEMDNFFPLREKGEVEWSIYGTIKSTNENEIALELEQTKLKILQDVGVVSFNSEPVYSKSNDSYFFHAQVENKNYNVNDRKARKFHDLYLTKDGEVDTDCSNGHFKTKEEAALALQKYTLLNSTDITAEQILDQEVAKIDAEEQQKQSQSTRPKLG